MSKNLSIRLAWHDNKWNGQVCKDPKNNVYCRGNYSLLSSRIQRRIDLDLEDKFKGVSLPELIKKTNYIPPCYWSINAFGNQSYTALDSHPFGDLGGYRKKFESIPPLTYSISPFTLSTWPFSIGYGEGYQRYTSIPVLKNRTQHYLSELKPKSSIAFLYCNYSNPLTGDDYKYALVGVGLIEDTESPQDYEMNESFLKDMRKDRSMSNFPAQAWQLQLTLSPENSFVLPYHEYLEWYEQSSTSSQGDEWEKLSRIIIPIEDQTLVPNFKYVSSHMSHDQAIFLLYRIRTSMNFIKTDQLIDSSQIELLEEKLQKLLQIAWNERGKFPGFLNAVYALLENDFDTNFLNKVIDELRPLNESDIEVLLDTFEISVTNPTLIRALNRLKREKLVLEFLSRFDFSIIQFENTLSIINQFGFNEIERNPYLILENYSFEIQKNWNIDQSDSGLDIYNFDIALIPDPEYVSWFTDYDAQSPERLRVGITKILKDESKKSGSSCMSRDDIITELENYPLYYVNKNLMLNKSTFLNLEKQPIFTEKFVIHDDSFRGGEITYQLNEIRKVESIIEKFIEKMLSKKHGFDSEDKIFVKKLLEAESNLLENNESQQRQQMYENIIKNGFFILSGQAGSGKTSSLINLIKNFKEKNSTPIYVLTPTGKSNLVIRDRLKKLNLHNDVEVRVSTIHRFLYSAIREHHGTSQNKGQMDKYKMHLERILDGRFEFLDEFISITKDLKLKPRILIIDESSMVDDKLLAILFSVINPIFLKHLILVGDDKQLPPIGQGIPFVNSIFYLHKNNFNENYVRLITNLRFDSSAGLGKLSDLFAQEKEPVLSEIKNVLESNDSTLSIEYFEDEPDLRMKIQSILQKLTKSDLPIPDQFAKLIEQNDDIVLDSIQILSPRRVGAFGTRMLNNSIIKQGKEEFSPKTKLICEENVYVWVKNQGRSFKQLGLSNGSMGYIQSNGTIFFDDIKTLKEEFDSVDISSIESNLPGEKSVLKFETSIDLGYAITVHKSQGSDFEDVIFILSDLGSFVLKELAYTGFTRARKKLHLLVKDSLKDNLVTLFSKMFDNSSVQNRKTMMFGYKKSVFRPHKLTRKDGSIIETRSKIEYMIAKNLDDSNLEFDYEPKEFLSQYRIIPDFKINEQYYLEHLGNMKNHTYRNRWNQKLKIYRELGILDNLITTEESQISDFESSFKKLIADIKNNKLAKTLGGHSDHHYII